MRFIIEDDRQGDKQKEFTNIECKRYSLFPREEKRMSDLRSQSLGRYLCWLLISSGIKLAQIIVFRSLRITIPPDLHYLSS